MPVTVGGTSVTFNDSSSQGTAYIGANSQSFGSNGTFTVPAGITRIIVSVWGGGGGGQAGRNPGFGGNGSTGGFGKALITGLTPGSTISVTVGSGGNGGNAVGGVGSAGGTSSFGTYVTCTGGAGGDWGVTSNGTATFSGVNTILNKPVIPLDVNAFKAVINSLGLGDVGNYGYYTDTGRFPGGGGGGGCGGGGAGGAGDAGLVTSGAFAYGPGENGGSSPSANGGAGGTGGGNNVSSNGGTGGSGSSGIWGGGGGGGGGFVLVQW